MTVPKDTLTELSAALVARTKAARLLVAEIRDGRGHVRSGTLWRDDVAIASEQSLPKADAFEIVHANGTTAANLAGRDAGTNVAVLRLEQPTSAALPAASEAETGALALAFGSDASGGVTVRLGAIAHAGNAWHSRAGGKIDRRIYLDVALAHGDEGGPVLDASGHLLGISTPAPRGRVLVIPASTVERVIDPLLAHGRIARGWLGLALQPVAVPEQLRAAANQESGLMVMSTVASGPAASAGIVTGDMLLQIEGVPITHTRRIAEQLGPDSIGQKRDLKLIRAGVITTVSPVITARPSDG